jgi:outer membrane lipoprotein-sorting protein
MTEHPADHRDERIAAALAELEVPEHDPEFFERLEARLAVGEPRPLRRRRARRLPRGRRVAWAVRVAAVLAAAAVLVLVLTFTLPRLGGPENASAASIQARVRAAFADAKTMHGRIVSVELDVRTGKFTTSRFWFARTARGDFRLRQLGGPSDLAYDAATGTERSINTSASIGAGRFYAERRGLAPGPPDSGPSDSILGQQLGATVRALLAAHDPPVREVVYRGRKAWRLTFAVAPSVIAADVDRLAVTIDEATALPLDVVATLHGAVRSELRIDQLAVNTPLPPNTFRVRFPPRTEVLRTDEGFRRRSLGGVAALAGYEPLVPSRLPAGFRLAEVAVAKSAAPTAGGRNPRSRDVVSNAYRRGFDEVIVTTRLRGRGQWRDPFGIEGIRLRSEPVRLSSGALAGSTGELVVDPRTPPHLWAETNDLIVTVSGDLSRSQLLRAANSLTRETP